jgi:hypothetical protein
MLTSQEGQKNEDTRTAPHTPTKINKKVVGKGPDERGPYKNKGVMWGRVEHSHTVQPWFYKQVSPLRALECLSKGGLHH